MLLDGILNTTTTKGHKMTTQTTEAQKFFSKPVVAGIMANLRSEFPTAIFTATWSVTPYGKPAAFITGQGKVFTSQMEAIADKHYSAFVYVSTKSDTYPLF